MPRAIVAALLALLMIAPTAVAHLPGARPILQRAQFDRIVDLRPGDVALELHLEVETDPLRHLVIHEMDPSQGRFYVEYRKDASVAEGRYYALWDFRRLLEFRDVNANGKFEDATDTVVRSWRFEYFDWRRDDLQNALLEDVRGFTTIWTGNLTGAPTMRIQAAFAGKDFADEGAIVRPQDVILYYDVTNIPERGIGSLYAFEIDVSVRDDAVLALHRVNETPTAILADAYLRRAFLVWGGEGLLDGREQRLDAEILDETVAEGNKTARLVVTLPTVDRSMRFVMVAGIEYGTEQERSPTPMPPILAAVALAIALLLGRRRR